MQKITIAILFFVAIGVIAYLSIEQDIPEQEKVVYSPTTQQSSDDDTLLQIGMREIWNIEAVNDITPFAIIEGDSIGWTEYKQFVEKRLSEGDKLTLLFLLETPYGNISNVELYEAEGKFATKSDVSEYFAPLHFAIEEGSPFADSKTITVKLSFEK